MANIRIRVDGLKEATQRLDDVGDRARRPEPALRADATRRSLRASERRRFSHARGWRRISPEWAATKRRRGLDPRVMRATGQLARTLTGAGVGEVRFSAYNGVLTWGLPWRSSSFYAAAQAEQGRRAVVIDRRARGEISERVARYIATGNAR